MFDPIEARASMWPRPKTFVLVATERLGIKRALVLTTPQQQIWEASLALASAKNSPRCLPVRACTRRSRSRTKR